MTTPRLIFSPLSPRVPPELLERLRLAPPQVGLRQGEIAAAAIDRFLADYRF